MWLRLECTQIPHLPHPRLLVERFSGRFWTWLDREEFLVPKNVLDIVAAQTVTWMGLFYCPLLPLLNSAFLFLTFYIKKVGSLGQRSLEHCILLPPPSPGPQTPWSTKHPGKSCYLDHLQYTLLRNSKASPRLFRASSSTFFFQLVLLLGLLLAAVPLAYVITR